ncbi:18816_t:CDS:2, partial [Racocetra persica]
NSESKITKLGLEYTLQYLDNNENIINTKSIIKKFRSKISMEAVEIFEREKKKQQKSIAAWSNLFIKLMSGFSPSHLNISKSHG